LDDIQSNKSREAEDEDELDLLQRDLLPLQEAMTNNLNEE